MACSNYSDFIFTKCHYASPRLSVADVASVVFFARVAAGAETGFFFGASGPLIILKTSSSGLGMT
ncbi:hypothetical protein D3C79_1120850 [compost metagenome]